MTQPRSVHFEVGENGGELVAARHCVELRRFKIRRQSNRLVSRYLDKHQLVNQMIAKVGKVGKVGSDLSEVTDRSRSFDAQAVGIHEDSFFLEPCEEMAIGAFKLDLTQAAIT